MPKKKRKVHVQKSRKDSTSIEDNPDAKCLYCKKLYSKSTEGWIGCAACRKWAYNSCAEVDSDDEALHICKYCLKYNLN